MEESSKFLKDRELRRGKILTYFDTQPKKISMDYVYWNRAILKFAQESPFYQTRIPSIPTPLKCSSKVSKKRKRGVKDLQDRIRNSHAVIPRKLLKVAGFLRTNSTSLDMNGGENLFDTTALEDLFPTTSHDKNRSDSFQEGQEDVVNANNLDEDGDEIDVDAGDYTRNYNESDDEGGS